MTHINAPKRGSGRRTWKLPGERISEYPRITCRVDPETEKFLEEQRSIGETDQSLMTRLIKNLQGYLLGS
jgi:hypothetical protein